MSNAIHISGGHEQCNSLSLQEKLPGWQHVPNLLYVWNLSIVIWELFILSIHLYILPAPGNGKFKVWNCSLPLKFLLRFQLEGSGFPFHAAVLNRLFPAAKWFYKTQSRNLWQTFLEKWLARNTKYFVLMQRLCKLRTFNTIIQQQQSLQFLLNWKLDTEDSRRKSQFFLYLVKAEKSQMFKGEVKVTWIAK